MQLQASGEFTYTWISGGQIVQLLSPQHGTYAGFLHTRSRCMPVHPTRGWIPTCGCLRDEAGAGSVEQRARRCLDDVQHAARNASVEN